MFAAVCMIGRKVCSVSEDILSLSRNAERTLLNERQSTMRWWLGLSLAAGGVLSIGLLHQDTPRCRLTLELVDAAARRCRAWCRCSRARDRPVPLKELINRGQGLAAECADQPLVGACRAQHGGSSRRAAEAQSLQRPGDRRG